MTRPTLWALLFGNFCIGTGVMAVAGALNDISDSLAVSPAVAGQLITAGAALMCIGAPLSAVLVAGWDRRRLLALAMLWYAVFHAVCALMPSFATLLPVRILTMVAPAVFTPQAAASVALLVPLERRSQAVTFIFLGWSAASVLGIPMAAWTSGHFGWRWAFAGIALLSVIAAAWVWKTMPAGMRPQPLSRSDWRAVLGSPLLMGLVCVTALQGIGQFTLLSYMAPVLKMQIHADTTALSVIWLWFGVCGLAGSVILSHGVGRVGAPRSALWTMALMTTSLALWPFATQVWHILLFVIPWGLGCFATNSAQQARLLAIAPALASASAALNTSAIYVGQAVGTGAGGWMLAHDWTLVMSWGGALVILFAMLLSWRLSQREPGPLSRHASPN